MSTESEVLLPYGDALLLSDFPNFAEFDLSKDILMLQSNGLNGDGMEIIDCNSLKPSIDDLEYLWCTMQNGGGHSQEYKDSTSEHSETSDECLMNGWMDSEKLVENAMNAVTMKPDNLEPKQMKAYQVLSDESPIERQLSAGEDSVMLVAKDMFNSMSLEEDLGYLDPFEQESSIPLAANSMTPILEDELPIHSSEEDLILAPSLNTVPSSLEEASFSHMDSSTTQATSLSFATMLSASQAPPCGAALNTSIDVIPSKTVGDVGQAPTGVLLNTKPPLNTRIAIGIPSVFHIGSPLPSPTTAKSTPNDDKMNFNSLISPTLSDATSVNECCGLSSVASPQTDVYASYPAIQRSQSSHALGQYRSPRHLSTCPEEFSLAEVEMQIAGFINMRSYPGFPTATSPVCTERHSVPAVRRVFSTGDLEISYASRNLCNVQRTTSEEIFSSRVGHLISEERKVKLHRYRQKRNERNFSKKIKYACRKTLADSRPRIRGRFARTLDDAGDYSPKENGSSNYDDYDDVKECGMMALNGFYNPSKASYWHSARINATRRHKL